MTMKISLLFYLLVLLVIGIVLAGAWALSQSPEHRIRIGYTEDPMLYGLYTATDSGSFEQQGLTPRLQDFRSSNDVAYALLAGKIDAGFVGAEDAVKLLASDTGDKFRIAGAVTFPYGASLVVRKDLDLRLTDLEGRRIAAEEEDCALLKQFQHDARIYGVDTSNVTYVYMGFDTMIPALESGKVDAAVLTTSTALIAESQGHLTLYQNWDVEEEDECCPTYLQKVQYFLLVRDLDRGTVENLIRVFEIQNTVSEETRLNAVTTNSGFPVGPLLKYPASAFERADQLDNDTKTQLWLWLWT